MSMRAGMPRSWRSWAGPPSTNGASPSGTTSPFDSPRLAAGRVLLGGRLEEEHGAADGVVAAVERGLGDEMVHRKAAHLETDAQAVDRAIERAPLEPLLERALRE